MLDLEKSVYDLAKENPEVVEIMKDLGFDQIANPVIRDIVGKKMNIPFGCKMIRIKLDDVIKTFEDKGFEVINRPEMEGKHERVDK